MRFHDFRARRCRVAKLIHLVFISLFSCGDDEPTCPIILYPDGHAGMPSPASPDCIAAMIFAARDASTPTPAQADLDRYFQRWTRVVSAEPILSNRAPQRSRAGLAQFELETSNASVIQSWVSTPNIHPAPLTGDSAFDEILAALERPEIQRGGNDTGRGTKLYLVFTSSIFNEELVNSLLIPTSSRLPDPSPGFRDNGTWIWDSGGSGDDQSTAFIDFSFGWGDCVVQCDGLHDLRAIAPPDGPVTVFDMGGDPLPPFLSLSPNTLPP
jgi:hypothetical protein